MSAVKKHPTFISEQHGSGKGSESRGAPRSCCEETEDLTLFISNKALRKENTYLKEECKYLRKRLDNLENAVKSGKTDSEDFQGKHGSFHSARIVLEKKDCSEQFILANEELEKENFRLKTELKRLKSSSLKGSAHKEQYNMEGVAISEFRPGQGHQDFNLLLRVFIFPDSIDIPPLH